MARVLLVRSCAAGETFDSFFLLWALNLQVLTISESVTEVTHGNVSSSP
jgi:hypothetical protein